ncbi:LuxR family transcriptional regulator [Pseudorhodoferax soli]|uniref:LuxR family transcriptional regulator n=1 Tax=Pseudorhodoferax soli TaxID=545864 RepID=UPI001B8843BB|nr:LuxR family transcriptional regulator [Pseudorhodoferax soli]
MPEELREVTSVDEAFAAIVNAAREVGFDSCAYGYQHPLPFSRSEIFLLNNYAKDWRERYDDAQYLGVDPTVIRARASIEPIVWSNKLFRGAAQLWDEARSFGLRHGWAQSCFSPDGGVGLLSLARGDEPLSELELRVKDIELRWLVNVAHGALSPWAVSISKRRSRKLTRREIEVLRWAGDGKTADETGRIISRSRFTVDFHFKNAMRKLGVRTRTAALARAAAMGLLR